MVTIILPVSRTEYLERVITSLELIDCVPEETNILAIVDGSDALFVRVRNLINGSKFNKRLTVKSKLPGAPPRLDIYTRRKRIAAIHNQVKELIEHDDGFVFTVEDDTTFGGLSLQRLLYVANSNRAFGMCIGVEVARWGVPYVGAWLADDVYEPTVLSSVENFTPVPSDYPEMRIDAGGLYCSLIRTELYKNHVFHCENGLGPDVNFGLSLRQLGYENFLVWQVQCIHYNTVLGKEIKLTPSGYTKQLTLNKTKKSEWRSSY